MNNETAIIEWAGAPVEAEILKTMKNGNVKVRFFDTKTDHKLYMIKVLPTDQVFDSLLGYHYKKLKAVKKEIYLLLQEKAKIEKVIKVEKAKVK